MELSKNEIIFVENNAGPLVNLENEKMQRKILLEKNYGKLSNMNMQEEYLRKTILMLERRQLAETISCVTSYSNKDGEPQFEVRFEKAFNEFPEWMFEDFLDELNIFRDQSLFSFYNIPQKTLFSHTCNNVIKIMINSNTILYIYFFKQFYGWS